MAEEDPNLRPPEGNQPGSTDDAPEEPRREASARFVVQGAQSSQAELRQALNPANQSLAEALRLSYRVLQVGILALIVTFLFSGFQSVREGATGVKTLFGRIVGGPGGEQLAPGLHPFWPYPVGDLVVFQQKQSIRLDKEFQPRQNPNQLTKEDQLAGADAARDLVAQRDGFVITADGDLAHLALSADYVVEDAVEFLGRLGPTEADAVVRRALMRGVVLGSSELTLRELLEQRETSALVMKEKAQQILDRLQSGVALTGVTLTETSAPRFVEAKIREVQAKRVDAEAEVVRAQQEVTATLTATVGGGTPPKEMLDAYGPGTAFEQLVRLIQEYDGLLVKGETAEADAVMKRIGARMEAPDISGDVARIIQQAKAARSSRESALSSDLRRLEGLAPAFRDNPRQLTRQLWLEAVRAVTSGPEVEIIATPFGIGGFDLKFVSSQQVMQRRREIDMARRKAKADEKNLDYQYFEYGSQAINVGRPGGRLNREATGGAGRDNPPAGPN